ncbi:STIP-like protein [Phytophthora infestans T30-4]|uniref:STIP-like protein n=1 Tax=Phytophthora infestans (strain T30-4) TaxID=403677 RepID=D0N2T4_PHYIT|nr:STIP-like protein [Phytophthora infestans T30-4]EEY69226.1 STIP-like protein [Phytophthora infestans T30-4]|eukprot:XP_002999080.1 STIP-like protein [Phytophthora infestans T30-4]
MASSDGGMSNADFARILDSNPMESAARRRRQEMAPTGSTQDADEMPRASGLGFGSNSGPDLASASSFTSGLGFRPSSGTGLGLGADTQDAVPSRPVKTKTYGWEKHTTGFGTKMLAKMGFKGRLGKKEDGVSATIEVKKRPTQMGMGYGDFVEASNLKQNRKLQKELKGETVEDDDTDKQAGGVVEDDSLWRKRKVVTGRRKHKRAADLTQEAHDLKKHKRNDTILDMRGPSVRVLSDVAAVYDVDPQRVEAAKPKLGDELIYNVRMVVNLAEGKIYDLTQKIDSNKESLVGMKKEAQLIKAQLDVDDVRLQHMQAMVEQMKALDTLREKALEMQSVEPIVSHLRTVRRSFPLVFEAHKLQQLVPSICMPPLRMLLTESKLLDQASSDRVVLQFQLVQAFLTELPSNRTAKDATESRSVLPVIREKTVAEGDDLYNFILEETLWPAMVQCVNVDWHAKSAPAECVDLYLKFRPHLSDEFEDAFLDQLVLARLKKECHRWDPRSDTILIHEWLLPWLPYVGYAMKSLYPDIRLALASALNQWHPSDLSVLAVLSPWRELWGEREYGKFTHRHIVRKLIRCLHREFEINPENQSLEALTWVLAWKDHLPHRQFIALLEGEFFPKWLKVLHKWVSGSPDLAELEKWYCGWKLLFEKNKLATNERLVVHFHGALVLLHAATELFGVPADSRPLVPELNGSAARGYQDALALAREEDTEEPPVREEKKSPRTMSSRSVSLKDVIENVAISHNLTFMPKGVHDGQQVYTFGEHQIIIEQGVVFVEKSKGVFKPVDLEQLL